MGVRDVTRAAWLVLFAAMLVTAAAASDSNGHRKTSAAEQASVLEIVLSLDSMEVGVSEPGTWLPISLTNISQVVGGFEVSLLLDRPDLFRFSSDSVVETTIVCIDTIDCDPADTTIDTVLNSPVDTVGFATAGWDFVQGRALTTINLKIAALADQGVPNGDAIEPGGPRQVCRVYLERIVPADVLDTLTDRSAHIFIDASGTSFSTPEGTTIGRVDSLACSPSITQCDSMITVSYTDTTAFQYFDGARTFTDACVRGDVNESGSINSADIIFLVNFVFKGGPEPLCNSTQGDVNCNGITNSADIIFLVNFVFKGGPPPPSSC